MSVGMVVVIVFAMLFVTILIALRMLSKLYKIQLSEDKQTVEKYRKHLSECTKSIQDRWIDAGRP